jgi:hypothetical protein
MTEARATAISSTPIWWVIVEVSMNQASQAKEDKEDDAKRLLEGDSHCRPGLSAGEQSATLASKVMIRIWVLRLSAL